MFVLGVVGWVRVVSLFLIQCPLPLGNSLFNCRVSKPLFALYLIHLASSCSNI